MLVKVTEQGWAFCWNGGDQGRIRLGGEFKTLPFHYEMFQVTLDPQVMESEHQGDASVACQAEVKVGG